MDFDTCIKKFSLIVSIEGDLSSTRDINKIKYVLTEICDFYINYAKAITSRLQIKNPVNKFESYKRIISQTNSRDYLFEIYDFMKNTSLEQIKVIERQAKK